MCGEKVDALEDRSITYLEQLLIAEEGYNLTDNRNEKTDSSKNPPSQWKRCGQGLPS
jgi:hypothetical protein